MISNGIKMNEQELQQFLEKLAAGVYTNEEYQVFASWTESCSREEYESMLVRWEHISAASPHIDKADPHFLARMEQALDQIDEQRGRPVIPLYPATGKRRFPWPRMAAAAAALAFLTLGLYQYLHKNAVPPPGYANDIAPGTNQPFLTLANGQKVPVGDNSGLIARQAGVSIQRDTAGQVSYTGNAQVTHTLFNTLTNPRGGKVVTLLLPDGTTAKLEAASSITYPTAFTGKSRNVSTTGKVYFAVTHHKDQPFYVNTKGQLTQDLGTHFIVEAYDDEPTIKTTLIEGSILVSKNGQRALLKPGQQVLAAAGLHTQPADLDEASAWINGDFYFASQELHSVMRELARVYDVNITYREGVENLVLDGMISRSHPISAVLQMIAATGKVHFEINGREVIVLAGTK